MRWCAVFVCLAVLAMARPAFADCEHQGRTYPEGTRIGPFVCENGQWVPG